MDATEYGAIGEYLQTNIITPEIKSDRYRKKKFVRECKGIYCQENKLMKIRTCHDCQTSAALPPQPQQELQPVPPPGEPWCHCGIDLICNIPRTVLWFQHILVIVCYLSKFVIARPLKTKTSKEILDCLQEIYLSFGVPNILQHDQGTEFSSKEFQEFHKKININTRRTTAYHPQSNGLVESHNKILKT
ncbi:hypothetical protein LOD99_6171 [Oopsacas minuta]|uniref:Integrase catalytic domain-containing protein n=1 Tax=Oopsacas minuta TaxID=111878 RepID=A0AAV7JNK4_9METZ|nr:hypothetical protein LOD99_6171 [Oopsacas minuta]